MISPSNEQTITDAIQTLKFHANMLEEKNEYTEEYLSDLLTESNGGGGIQLSKAIKVILEAVKGEVKHEHSKAS